MPMPMYRHYKINNANANIETLRPVMPMPIQRCYEYETNNNNVNKEMLRNQ